MGNRAARRSGGALKALRAIFVLLLVSCAGLAAYVYFIGPDIGPSAAATEDLPETAAAFVEGVFIEELSLAGMTMEQAQSALHSKEQELLNSIHFQIDAPEKSSTLTAADFNIQFDTSEVLMRAFQLGNTGSRKERNEERERLLTSPAHFNISYTMDTSRLAIKLRELAIGINTPPTDASVQMDMAVEGWFQYTEGTPGVTLDEDQLLQNLQDLVKNKRFGPVELPLEELQPEVTVEMLKNSLARRAKAETSFAKTPYNREDRVYNVKRAASLINGFVLKPGEEFSTNNTLGPRTYELGWKPAPAYVNGATEDQAGGGVCQVSSTLYNAVVKADLEIVYRRNHSSTVAYVPRGLDATINTGTIDFTFKNNTGSDIYIFAYTIDKADGPVPEGMDNKTLHIEVFGEPFSGEYDEIKLSSEKIETLEPSGEMEIIVDSTAAWDFVNEEVARRQGAVYQSYKHYLKDGVEIKKENLAKSTYRAFAGRKIVGPGYYATQQALPGGEPPPEGADSGV